MNKKIVFFFVFAFCLFIFFWFCFFDFESQDMEVVELLTSEAGRRSWMKLLFNRLRMGHPPLYFLFSKLLVGVTGHTQVGLYSFPMITGALGIPLIYFLGKELGLGRGALWASLFWSVNPAILYYSRYIRPQIGVAVLCAFYLFVLLRNLEHPKISNKFLLFVLGLCGALWSPLFLFFWLGIFGASLLIPKIRQCASKAYWWTIGSAIFASGLVLGVVRNYSGSVKERLEWVELPSAYDVYKIMIQALGTVEGKIHFSTFRWLTPFLGLICFVLVFYLNNIRKQDASRGRIQVRDKWNLLMVGGLISTALFLIFTFGVHPMWRPRYLVILLPIVPLVMAQVVQFITWRWAAVVFGLLVATAGVINSFSMITQRNFGLRAAVVELEKRYDDSRDAVLTLNIMTQEAFRLYSREEFDLLVIKSTLDYDTVFQMIDEHVSGKERLWILEFPRKYAIRKTEKWQSYEREPFFDSRNNKLALSGYIIK